MSAISQSDRDAYERDKQFLWLHCAQDHELTLLETEEFDLWLVATRTLRAELAKVTKERDEAREEVLSIGRALNDT